MNDRRKIHRKENLRISFWKDNKIGLHHRVEMGLIISDYLMSKYYQMQRGGMPFARCILGFMAFQYGAFDVFKDGEMESLKEILDFRLKQFGE